MTDGIRAMETRRCSGPNGDPGAPEAGRGPIAAVVLAAGRSSRMGRPKLLLPLGGRAVIARVIDAVLASTAAPVAIVAGAEIERLRQALQGRTLTWVLNPDPAAAMLDSVRLGLQALPSHWQAVVIVLGDQPGLDPETIDRLADKFAAGGRGIVVPVHKGRRGHPILVAARHRDEILRSHDGLGLRGLLRAHPEDVQEIETDRPSVLEDMDTPSDYREWRERLGR